MLIVKDLKIMTLRATALVSVVIPCYNQAHFLDEAIRSVLAQSYCNIEVIVVDDGSLDHTAEVGAQYPSIHYLRQFNQGLSAARNAGLNQSRGDYLVFLDADDRLLPRAVDHGLAYLTAHPECAFVSGQYRRIASDGSVLPTWREQRLGNGKCFVSGNYRLMAPDGSVLDTWERRQVASDHYAALLQRNYIEMHATVMYRRRVLAVFGGFDPSLSACEDYDMYLRIARAFPIACHPHVVADYRQHDASMTRNSARMLTAALRVLHSQWPYIQDNIHYRQAYKEGEKFWRAFYARQALGDTRSHLKKLAWQKAVQSAKLPIKHILMKGKWFCLEAVGFACFQLKVLWQRLTRVPVGRLKWGDSRRLKPLGGNHAAQDSVQIPDYYIHRFLNRRQADIAGRVLLLRYNAVNPQFSKVNCHFEEIVLDPLRQPLLNDLEKTQLLKKNKYDCIIMPQLLQRVYNLEAAIDSIFQRLKPGGALLLTVPGFNQNRRVDQSYWAFSGQLIRRLLAKSFPQENISVSAWGNVLAATAHLHHLPGGALSKAQLKRRDPHYPLVVGARAVKPVNPQNVEEHPWDKKPR